MSTEGRLLAEDPFADPSMDISRTTSETGMDLYVDRNVRLSLGSGYLVVHDSGFKHRSTLDCCGLLSNRTPDTQAIPYFNILDASISDLELCIVHALPTSKTTLRPAYITYTLSDKNTVSIAQAWVNSLMNHAYGTAQRRKRIKVLINPYGGQGAASKFYARDVEPIFKAARCEIDVQDTTHSGHAVEIAQELDIERFDVVACCSGDGLPHEVFNGLAKQHRPRRALRRVAVVQIPCGSGNAMSLNLNGTNWPSLAALAVVKGVRTPLDLIAITQGDKRYLSFLSQSVGIVAETDLGTDNIRWMGGARFTYGFLVRLLGKTVYPAEISVKVIADNKDAVRSAYHRNRSKQATIAAKRPEDREQESQQDQEDESLPPLRYGTVNDTLPSDWHTTDMPTLGNFYAGNMTYMSADTPFFPAALPNDNAMDLVNIDGMIPRMHSVNLLLAVEKNTFFDEEAVNYRKVAGYRISPRLREGQKEGFISIDGEKVPFEPFQAEIMGGLGTVLSKNGAVYEFGGPKELN